MSDKRIIKRIKHRDETAIKKILKKYGGLIKMTALRHLYSHSDCIDECINDVLFAVWENIDNYHPEKSSFKNWILVITKYKAINIIRKHSKDALVDTFDDMTVIGRSDDGLSLWEMEWFSLIETLPLIDQELLTLIYIEGFSPEEASEKTGMKTSNVYNCISRLRKKMKLQAETGGASNE
ncbi:sigma-70 family RNA polymerase sigma factor [Corticicoccus populi]|uniref:Sigma-70 family RNA polymerase sigma factor n=1 Tax=Corticicoccus populi TaxID=1812821 RepID=A0ABW5WXA1_9STAP